MATARCLDCGRIEKIKGEKDKFGLCDKCYKAWLKRDPVLTKWAFEEKSLKKKKGGE